MLCGLPARITLPLPLPPCRASLPTACSLAPPPRPPPCSRQFGHRVKGVSMSTFKKDEVETLRQSGNEVRQRLDP